MPHAIEDETYTRPIPVSSRKSKAKNSPKTRDQQHLHTLLSDLSALYQTSQLSTNLTKTLHAALKSTKTPPTKILSLGLGSITTPGKGQTRRLKQLTILLALRTVLQKASTTPIQIYAQDPIFTRTDESLFSTLDIKILHTASGSSLGEASTILSASTIIYSPFLTLEAYEQLLLHSKQPVQLLIGDDFNALREKWPKFSAERRQVEGLMRGVVGGFRRRGIAGEEFWEEADEGFPMAVYGAEERRERARM